MKDQEPLWDTYTASQSLSPREIICGIILGAEAGLYTDANDLRARERGRCKAQRLMTRITQDWNREEHKDATSNGAITAILGFRVHKNLKNELVNLGTSED